MRTDVFLEQKAQREMTGVCIILMSQTHRALLWTAGAEHFGTRKCEKLGWLPGEMELCRALRAVRSALLHSTGLIFAGFLPHLVHSILPPLTMQVAMGFSSVGFTAISKLTAGISLCVSREAV